MKKDKIKMILEDNWYGFLNKYKDKIIPNVKKVEMAKFAYLVLSKNE